MKPRFELMPKAGLVRAALRFEEGLNKHGDKAWNNLSPNQSAMTDREWLIERCSHAIQHYFTLIDKLAGKIPLDEGEDDAGAVAWAGIMLAAAMTELEKK